MTRVRLPGWARLAVAALDVAVVVASDAVVSGRGGVAAAPARPLVVLTTEVGDGVAG